MKQAKIKSQFASICEYRTATFHVLMLTKNQLEINILTRKIERQHVKLHSESTNKLQQLNPHRYNDFQAIKQILFKCQQQLINWKINSDT